MKKKTILFILVTIIIAIFIIFLMQNSIYAQVNPNSYDPGNFKEGQNFKIITGRIIRLLTNIGMSVSAIGITIIGVQTMLGSVEEKAKYKEKVIPFLIGCLLICTVSIVVKALIALSNTL